MLRNVYICKFVFFSGVSTPCPHYLGRKKSFPCESPKILDPTMPTCFVVLNGVKPTKYRCCCDVTVGEQISELLNQSINQAGIRDVRFFFGVTKTCNHFSKPSIF